MEQKVKEITRSLLSGELESPDKLSKAQEFLAAYYSQVADEYADLQNTVNYNWLQVRKNTKTDTQADREVQVSDEGKRLVLLKYKMKSLEKLISSIKNRIHVKNNEIKNLY